MHAGQIIFSQIMDFIPLHEFHKCVRDYHGQHLFENSHVTTNSFAWPLPN